MRKLIFGCGYLGERIAKRWMADGHTVSAVTRSTENAAHFRGLGIEPILADITDASSLNGLPEAETVLFAVGFDRSAGMPMREVYVGGLQNALAALEKRSVRQVLYISSTSVYGQNHGEWVDENSPCNPLRDNGKICLEAEQLLGRFIPTDNSASESTYNVLRLAGIYGPNRLLGRVESLRNGTPLQVDPEGWLNLIHVDDAVSSVLACELNGQPRQTYLIADDRPVQRREFYGQLAEFVNAPQPTFVPPPQESDFKSLNKRCRNTRMHAELKFELSYPSSLLGLPHALANTI